MLGLFSRTYRVGNTAWPYEGDEISLSLADADVVRVQSSLPRDRRAADTFDDRLSVDIRTARGAATVIEAERV